MDLKDAIVTIQQTAQAAKQPQITKLDARKNAHETRLLMPAGTIETVVEDVPLREHTVFDIDSLATWSAKPSADGDEAPASDAAHIWHSDEEAILILDDEGYRENTVTLPLPQHPKFTAIADQTAGKFSQKSLIDFLRLNLKQEIEEAYPGFIATLREIKFSQGQAGASSIQHGKESMGQTIDSQVTGADKLPEEVTIEVPIWLHLDCTVKLDFAFDIDTAAAQFSFRPKPGVIDQAMATAQAWLHQRLTEECKGAVIHFGRP